MQRKRSNSTDLGPVVAKRPKHTTIWDDKEFATVEEAVAEIAALKSHLDTAIHYINDKGLTRSAPDGLKTLINARLGSKELAKGLKHNIDEAAEPLQEQSEDADVSGDDFSSAMSKFLPAIRDIAELPDPDALQAAYDVLWYAKNNSYIDPEEQEDGVGYGDRPSDEPFDEFFVELIAKRTAAGQVWDWERDLGRLKGQAERLEAYGIEPWYPKTRKALEALVAAKKGDAQDTPQ